MKQGIFQKSKTALFTFNYNNKIVLTDTRKYVVSLI